MKRILRIGIPMKIMALLALAALLLLLAPMLKAAQYDVPSADDYANGIVTYFAWRDSGSPALVLKAACDRVHQLYYSWQGTFTAIFLFTLNPMIFGEQYYTIGPWLMIGTLLAGIFFLTYTVWGKIFHANSSESLLTAVLWSILATQFLPRASQGFYWYTGAVYYTFFFALSLIAYAVLLRYMLDNGVFSGSDTTEAGRKTRGIGKLIAASLLLFFIGGGNLVTGLTTAVLLVSMEVLLMVLKKDCWKPLLIPILCFAISFGLNVSAPGNAARQVYFPQPGPFQAVLLSFREAGLSLWKWFTLPVIALLLMEIPAVLQTAARTERRFVLPGFVTLFSACLTGVMFYPPIYAMTEHNLDHLGRITNIIFFGMLFLALFNLFYWTGWLVQKGIISVKRFPAAAGGRFSVVFLLLILVLFGFGMTQTKWYDTTSISAFRSYRSGEMGNYWHTYKQRLEILKDPEVEDAVLKRFPYRPYVLFYQELSYDPYQNGTIAAWYGKNTIIIQ